MENKQLSLAQALGDLSKIEPDKLLGRKVFFIERSRSQKEVVEGTIISLSDAPGFVIVRKESSCVVSRPLSFSELYDDPENVPIPKIRRKKSVDKKKRQLSLAQALGDLSKINPGKLLGRKVVFECHCNNRHGARLKRKITVRGKIKEWAKTPGFALIEDEKGNQYSRDLSNVWGDVLE